MLARSCRLRRQKDFEKIFQAGRFLHVAPLAMGWRANNLDFSRFAFVVSGRVAKKSVARNRLRRRLTEIVRANPPFIRPGFDIVVVAKTGAAEKGLVELKAGLTALFEKAKLLHL